MTRARMNAIGFLLARLIVAGVFLFAAVGKIADPHSFAEAIANYHLVPDAVSSIAASIVPVLEVVLAIALIAGVKERGAALIAGVMLVVFAGAMISTIVRGINLDCGCFGASAEARVNGTTVARNVVLALASFAVAAVRHVSYREAVFGREALTRTDANRHH